MSDNRYPQCIVLLREIATATPNPCEGSVGDLRSLDNIRPI